MDYTKNEWSFLNQSEEDFYDWWNACELETQTFEDEYDWDELFGLRDEYGYVERPASTKNPLSQKNDTSGDTLFVRNLAKSVDVQQLTTLFAPFGTIARVNIVKDALGTSKGFGFVHFTNASDAGKALAKMDGHLLAGRKLHVALAHPPKWGTKK